MLGWCYDPWFSFSEASVLELQQNSEANCKDIQHAFPFKYVKIVGIRKFRDVEVRVLPHSPDLLSSSRPFQVGSCQN